MDIESVDTYNLLCMECESEQYKDNVTWDQIKPKELAEKLERLGIQYPSDSQEREKAALQRNNTINVLKQC